MCRVDVDRDTVGIEDALEASNDLATEAFLDGKAAGVEPDDPGQLRDPDDAVVGYVANPGLAEEREGMVLTHRMEGDRPLDDLADPAVGTTIALSGKGGDQLGIPFVTVGRVEERPDEPAWRFSCCRRVESHAHHLQDLRGMTLQLSPLRFADLPGRNTLPFSAFLGKGITRRTPPRLLAAERRPPLAFTPLVRC